jgi:hypothetical protein
VARISSSTVGEGQADDTDPRCVMIGGDMPLVDTECDDAGRCSGLTGNGAAVVGVPSDPDDLLLLPHNDA